MSARVKNFLRGSPFKNVRDALTWRIRRRLDPIVESATNRFVVAAAMAWRVFLKRPVFIGITGSAGKTTMKELLVAVLSQKKRGLGTPGNENITPFVARLILRIRPKDDFCVAELPEHYPGAMDEVLPVFRPGIGIVTVAKHDHVSSYDSAEGIAAEMGKLIAKLPSTGTAVLNADDERVLAMAVDCGARVISYGTNPAAALQAQDISSVWPDRLKLTVTYRADRVRVRTQLCGSHFVPSVLGAIGGGLASGMSLAECAEGIAGVPPFTGRMQPVTTDEGVTFIRDDFKAPLWTFDASLEFMKSACASRKIIVIGELSDTGTGKVGKYTKAASQALDVADIVVFVGPWSSSAHKARRQGKGKELRAFSQVYDAAEYINSVTRSGDLVLLKGTNKQDHLLRIILARSGAVACWRDNCQRPLFCDVCPSKDQPSGIHVLSRAAGPSDAGESPAIVTSDDTVIVGLGNPDPKFSETPHNVGYALVDQLSISLGVEWEEWPEAWIARGSASGVSVCLIKVRQVMNLSGGALKQLSKQMSFTPEQCILVFDDLALPLGSVRLRMDGSAGGHRGVASILEAFQTDAFRRVKVGIGKEGVKCDRVEYVLSPFVPADQAIIEKSISDGIARVLELATRHPVLK